MESWALPLYLLSGAGWPRRAAVLVHAVDYPARPPSSDSAEGLMPGSVGAFWWTIQECLLRVAGVRVPHCGQA